MLRLVVDNGNIETPKGNSMFINHKFDVPVAPLGQNYGEWSYDFGNGEPVYAFHHIAAWQDEQRLKRIRKQGAQAVERRRNGRFMYSLTR